MTEILRPETIAERQRHQDIQIGSQKTCSTAHSWLRSSCFLPAHWRQCNVPEQTSPLRRRGCRSIGVYCTHSELHAQGCWLGPERSLNDYSGKKAVVLIFLGIDCPVGNLYAPRLVDLNREYMSKGVFFLGINSNAHESENEVARAARESAIDFPVLKDPENKVADISLVQRTCEVVLLDGSGQIRYRGAIDDQYVQGKAKNAPHAQLSSRCAQGTLGR